MPAIDLALRTPADDSDRKLLEDVSRFGWHLVGIAEEIDPPLPPYVFSVGMYYTLGSPELVVVGLPHEVAMGVLNGIGEAVRDGRQLVCNDPMAGFLDGFDVVMKPVAPTNFKEHLGYGVWFYRSLPQGFPCWQVFWPDRTGRFPWSEGCHSSVIDRQTNLVDSAT